MASALPPGGVNITLSDLIGTQVQSADTGNDETVSQTATPTNQNGLTGDKPIEATADVAKAGLSMGGTAALKTAAKAVGLTPDGQTSAATGTAADCVGEACSDTPK